MSLDPRFHPSIERLYKWYTEGTTCEVYLDGEPIGEVNICYDYAHSNQIGFDYEVADVRYGQLGGLLIPDEEDIRRAIADKLKTVEHRIIFPDKFTLEPKL